MTEYLERGQTKASQIELLELGHSLPYKLVFLVELGQNSK